MNVVPLKAFVPHISPLLEKCPGFVIEREVLKTVADACRATGCVTTTTEIKTRAGENDYGFDIPHGFEADIVRYVFCDGEQIYPVLYDQVAGMYPFDWRTTSGTPRSYSFRQHDVLTLFPVPDKEYTIRADVTVTVRLDMTVVPDMFLSMYLDLVTNGVMARVCQIAGQPYSNPQMALAYKQLYDKGIAELKAEAFRDYTRGAGRVMFNRIV